MKKLILLAVMFMSTQLFANVRADCELDFVVVEDGSLFATSFVFGEAPTEAEAVQTTFLRSLYECRTLYRDAEFGDGFDCLKGSMPVHLCGYNRVSGVHDRPTHLPNPPVKAKCIFKKDSCQFSSVARDGD